jgi:dienelactone hydrolase
MKTILIVSIILIGIVHTGLSQGIDISYSEGSNKLKGYFAKAKNPKGKVAGIVVLPAWMGLDENAKNAADKFSNLGYHAFAADIYGEGGRPKNLQEAAKFSSIYKNNTDLYQARIKSAINELIKQGADPKRIIVIGFCFGGTGALEAARGGLPVIGVASIHGQLCKDTTRANQQIIPKVLVLHGADDPYIPETEIKNFYKEMREGKADWQMVHYGNAVHAFTDPNLGTDNSKGAAYNEKAAKRSWEDLILFIKEVLGS